MQLNGRLIVFCLLTFTQVAVVLLLSSLGNSYVKKKLGVLVTNQIMNDNIAFTSHLERSIVRMNLNDLRIGADDWKILQDIVEHTRLPNGGFMCVLDLDTNRPICHPDFKDNPELSEQELPIWQELIQSGNMIAFDENKVVRVGKFEFGDEIHWVAGRTLGEFHVAVLALQRQDRIENAIANAAFPVTKLTVGICMIGLFMSTAFGLFVIWRTENKLAEATAEVERLQDPAPTKSRAFADVTTASPNLAGVKR